MCYNVRMEDATGLSNLCALKGCNNTFLTRAAHQKYCCRRCAERGRYRAEPQKYINKTRAHRTKNIESSRKKDRQWYALNTSRVSERRRLERLEKPWRYLVHAAKNRATIDGLPFDLTAAWCKARWTNRCELTNLEFVRPNELGRRGGQVRSPSIDKINPVLGYTQGNCRIILHCLNLFKIDGTDENMYEVAEALIANNPRRIARMGS